MKSNFKKLGKYILLLSSVLILVFSLTACEPEYKFTPVKGGHPEANTISNGGQVVQQGDKLYFVNGKTSNKDGNKYGDVLKGAIVRATVNDKDGSLSDFVTIAPKNVYASGRESGTDGGIYIFGENIYYMTPNDEIDKNDNLLNDRLDVWTCKIDGSNTKKLGTPIKSLDYRYKFVKNHLVTIANDTITIYKLEEGLPVVTTIKQASNVIMPKTEEYAANKKEGYVSDYIFYTRNLTEKEQEDHVNDPHINIFGAIKCDGTNQIEIVNFDTKFGDKANDNIFTLKDYLVEGDNITIYYTRKGEMEISSERLYSYTFSLEGLKKDDKKVYFDSSKEVLISNTGLSSIIPYTSDTVLSISDKMIYSFSKGVRTALTTMTEGETGTFDGSIITLKKEAQNKVWLYYTTSNGFFRLNIVNASGDLSIKIQPEMIFDSSMSNNVFGNELIGDYYYYCNSLKKDYVYRFNVNDANTITEIKENDNAHLLPGVKKPANPELVGIMTNADKKAIEDQEKDKD